MRDGFDVGGAVAEFDEEALVVFEAVGGSGDGVVEPVGVVIFEHLAGALLEIGGGHDFEIGLQRQPFFDGGAVRGLGYDGKDIEALLFDGAGQDDLGLPAVAVLGDGLAHGVVVLFIEADGFEDAGDVFVGAFDVEGVGN